MKKLLIIKILVQFFVILILTAIVVFIVLWSYQGARDELLSIYSRYTLTMAESNAKKIERKFQELNSIFDYLTETVKRDSIKKEAFPADYLKSVYLPIADDFFIFDETGEALYQNGDSFIKAGEREELRKAFLSTLIENDKFSTPIISKHKIIKSEKETLGILLYIKQVFYENDNKSAYLTFVISGKRILNNYIRTLYLDNKGYAYITDKDRVVISSGIKEQIGKSFEQAEEEEELKELSKIRVKASKSEIEKIKTAFEEHEKRENKIFDSMKLGGFGTEQFLNPSGRHIEVVSFYPIKIKGGNWSFAIEIPYKFVTDTFQESFVRSVILIVFIVTVFFAGFMYTVYNYKKRIIAELEINHITAHLEKEQALRKAEYKYKQLYQETRDITLICRNDFIIEEINNAGLNFIGSGIKEVANKLKFQDRFINENDIGTFITSLDKDESVTNFKTEVGADNACRYLEINADKYFAEKEKKHYIFFVIRDVTEHEKLQKEIIKKENLESAMALVVTANHEINNPLASIILSLEIVKNTISACKEGKIDVDVKKHIEDISNNVYRISNVLEKLKKIKSVKKIEYSNTIKMLDIDKS